MQLEKWFDSAIHAKIITFFHENPAAVDTLRGICVWVGHDKEKIRKALEDLVQSKILIANRGLTTTGYAYTRDEKIIRSVDEMLKKRKRQKGENW